MPTPEKKGGKWKAVKPKRSPKSKHGWIMPLSIHYKNRVVYVR